MPRTPARKLIVLTGATRGIGRAMTEKFIALGHTVQGCGRSRAHIEQLRQAFGAPHDFAMVDVAQEAQVENWAARVLAQQGPPDLLINNAALIHEAAPLWHVSGEVFDRVIDVNIKGMANVIRHFVPAMVARKSGIIVNISSGLGRSALANMAPYCATKWAVEGLTQALARELPAGMAAIPLNPGVIDTDMLRLGFGEMAREYPRPDKWSERAVPFLLKLGPKDNGKPLSIG